MEVGSRWLCFFSYWVVGILFSYWAGLSSGAMSVSGKVSAGGGFMFVFEYASQSSGLLTINHQQTSRYITISHQTVGILPSTINQPLVISKISGGFTEI